MWRWLHKNVLIPDHYARISIVVSCGFHFLVLIISLVLQMMKPVRQILIHKDAPPLQEITIIIDPYATSFGATTQALKDTQPAPQINNELRTDALNASVVIAHTPQKSELKTTPVVPVKKRPLKPKKVTPLSAKKKPITKKAAVPKREKKVPKAVIKQVPKKIQRSDVPEKPEVKKIIPSAPVCEESSLKPTPLVESVPSVPIEVPINQHIEGPILIARSASHAAALTVQLAIQEELLRVWHPPIGIPEGISCSMQITVDARGAVQLLEIKKSSGMFLFDVSARAAIHQAVWPHAVWGTTLELCLQ